VCNAIRMTKSGLPPGPSEPPAVQLAWWLARPISFMESCRRRFGDAFSVRFPGSERPTVMLSDPQAIRALYTEHRHGLPPGRTAALRPLLGASSVLLVEGGEHLARRRVMLGPFHGERMRSYEGIVREVAEREVAGWPRGEPFALHPHMQALTLEVILRAVFGVTDADRREQLRERLPRLLGQNPSVGLQLRVMLSRRLGRGDPLEALRELTREIDELLLAEIAERRLDPDLAEREDILSLLMSARLEDGSAMGDRDLRDQLVTLLLAGHETTATALAWTFDLLLHHPQALARLTAEVDTGAELDAGAEVDEGADGNGSAEADRGPEQNGGAREAYLRAVIAESLRLRPVVPLAGRRLAAELDVGDLHLPAGTDVTPAIWLTHTRPDLYPEPYAFRPERFLESPPSTYGWIPFGGGIRRCLGASFAEFEMRVVLQTVLRELRLAPVSRRPERVARRNVTFSPRGGTRVRVHARARAVQPAGRAPVGKTVPIMDTAPAAETPLAAETVAGARG
jgi:cytochrome P450 family 135